MKKKLEILFGEHKIIAEIYDDSEPEIPPELSVYICNKDNVILQDICLVRPHFEINKKTMDFETNNDFVGCLVWGESGYEDYTDKHVIAVYDEEEEE